MGKNHDWGQTGPLGDDSARIETLRDDTTSDGFEAGIAAVFEAIRNGDGDHDDSGEDAEVEDNGATFALLSELNRLWDSPQA